MLGADGNAYRAVQPVKEKDPTVSDESSWQLAHAGTHLVLDVPGRFKTIQQAWKFLDGATIASAATVTVQVAPGRYESKEELALEHPHGRQIMIAGSVYGMPPQFTGNDEDMKAWTPGRDVKPEEQIHWNR